MVSGFLITTLLLREREATGAHLAVRLLAPPRPPAAPRARRAASWCAARPRTRSAGTCCSASARRCSGAVTFSSNWLFLAAQSDYFELDGARALPQPLVARRRGAVLPALAAAARRRAAARAALAAHHPDRAASRSARPSRWRVLWAPESATRVYYGTDTHAFGLAIGAVLAVVALHWPARPLEWVRWHRTALGVAGTIALAGILAIGMHDARGCADRLPGRARRRRRAERRRHRGAARPRGRCSAASWSRSRCAGSASAATGCTSGTGRCSSWWSPRCRAGRATGVRAGRSAASRSRSPSPRPRCRTSSSSSRSAGTGSARRSRPFGAAFRQLPARVRRRRLGRRSSCSSAAIGTVGAVTNDPGTGETELLVQAGQEALDAANAERGERDPRPVGDAG